MALRLLAFLPCEKIIIADSGVVSLISILERVFIELPKDVDSPPSDAIAPIAWSVYALWERDTADLKTEQVYEQRVQLVLPDGTDWAPSGAIPNLTLTFAPGITRVRAIRPLLGFPVAMSGHATLILSIRGDEGEGWREAATYRLEVSHQVVPRD